MARETGVVCGVALAVDAFRLLDPKVAIRIDVEDGMKVSPGSSVLFVNGNARALLSAERVALNFLQRLSGIASLTAQFVAAIEGTGARNLTEGESVEFDVVLGLGGPSAQHVTRSRR